MWGNWTIHITDVSLKSCTLEYCFVWNREKTFQKQTPRADTAAGKCFPGDNWMLESFACSTFWMEIKASCNSTLTLGSKKPPLQWPSVDLIQEKKEKGQCNFRGLPGYVHQHSPLWPPGSKVKQTVFKLKPDQLVWQKREMSLRHGSLRP